MPKETNLKEVLFWLRFEMSQSIVIGSFVPEADVRECWNKTDYTLVARKQGESSPLARGRGKPREPTTS